MSDGKRTYEAMFVLDGSGADFEAASEPVRKILDRNEAEILVMKPWDDRRLAYEIKGRRRGLYALTYFKAAPSKVVEIEHDCQLTEQILRVLFLARDHVSDEELNAETPMTSAARRASEAARAQAARADSAAAEKQQQEPEDQKKPDSAADAPDAPTDASADQPAQTEEQAGGETEQEKT